MAIVEQTPLQDGRNMTMMLGPSKGVLAGEVEGSKPPVSEHPPEAAKDTPEAAKDTPEADNGRRNGGAEDVAGSAERAPSDAAA